MSDRNDYDDIDENDYEDESPTGRIRRVLSLVVLLAAVGGVGSLAYNMLKNSDMPVNESDLPVVEAENTPIREKPENPGGWQFEHQDKAVYNDLAAGTTSTGQAVAERIIPDEQPVELDAKEDQVAQTYEKERIGDLAPAAGGVAPATDPAASVAVVTGNGLAPVPAIVSENVAVVPVVATPVELPRKAAVIAPKSAFIRHQAVVKHVEKAPAALKQYASIESTHKSYLASSGHYMAQLGAFKSQTDASAAWGRIQGKHALLSSVNHSVERADLGDKGVMYRLRVGPFASETQVRGACAKLQAVGQSCFPVKL